MKIHQILNERISISKQLQPQLEKFIANLFVAATTSELPDKFNQKAGWPAINLDTISLLKIEKLFDYYNFADEIKKMVSSVVAVDKLQVAYGSKCHRNTSLSTRAFTDGTHGYLLQFDYNTLEHLANAYRELLGPLYRYEDKYFDVIYTDTVTEQDALNIVHDKDAALITGILKSNHTAQFCAEVIHEIAHIVTKESAFDSYKHKGTYNKELATFRSGSAKQHAQRSAKQAKLFGQSEVANTGLDSHFADPAELDSYAQEIAAKIKHKVATSDELPVAFIRQNLHKLVQKYRSEVSQNLKTLNKEQQKYIYKLYKRVYQEIADLLEGNKK